jgi:hypothetical protein
MLTNHVLSAGGVALFVGKSAAQLSSSNNVVTVI